jgi:hypothetical protein
MKSIRLLHLLKSAIAAAVVSIATIPSIVLANGDCRNLEQNIADAKQNAGNQQFERFTTDRPDGMAYNLAVDEIVNYVGKLNSEV